MQSTCTCIHTYLLSLTTLCILFIKYFSCPGVTESATEFTFCNATRRQSTINDLHYICTYVSDSVTMKDIAGKTIKFIVYIINYEYM